MLHENGNKLHQSVLVAIQSIVVLDLVMVDLLDCCKKVILDINLDDLMEEVFLLERFVLLQSCLVCLLKNIDALFDLSTTDHLPESIQHYLATRANIIRPLSIESAILKLLNPNWEILFNSYTLVSG